MIDNTPIIFNNLVELFSDFERRLDFNFRLEIYQYFRDTSIKEIRYI